MRLTFDALTFGGLTTAVFVFGAFYSPGIAAAVPQARHSAVLVELFTSEGCSSCPPADDLLRQINGRETAAGQLIVGISEHVTYWNHLGWVDPYSSNTYTLRQNSYASQFGLDSVYTPQMVINGREQIVGSDAAALRRDLAAESGESGIDLSILSDTLSASTLTLHFSAQKVISHDALNIIAVVTDDADRSNVLRGENAGNALQHVAVARALVHVAAIRGDSDQTVRVALPATALANTGTGHHLILFAQSRRSGRVLGVDSKVM